MSHLRFSWTLKARVFAKWPTRSYNGQYRSGKVFSFDICDDSSEIRVTAFDQNCENWRDKLTVGQVYRIAHGDVLLADPQYNALKHPFYIRLVKQTTIEPIANVPLVDIPLIHVQLVKISSLRTIGALVGK